jgi:hypothetical protein
MINSINLTLQAIFHCIKRQLPCKTIQDLFSSSRSLNFFCVIIIIAFVLLWFGTISFCITLACINIESE